MYKEGVSQNLDDNEKSPHERWIGQRVILEENLNTAEENFKNSNGREEYAKNIRARDAAQKALEDWDKNPPEIEYTSTDYRRLLELADHNLKHAKDEKEYENAMRDVDMLSKKLAAKVEEENK